MMRTAAEIDAIIADLEDQRSNISAEQDQLIDQVTVLEQRVEVIETVISSYESDIAAFGDLDPDTLSPDARQRLEEALDRVPSLRLDLASIQDQISELDSLAEDLAVREEELAAQIAALVEERRLLDPESQPTDPIEPPSLSEEETQDDGPKSEPPPDNPGSTPSDSGAVTGESAAATGGSDSIQPNVLHDYVNYTYSFTISVLSNEQYKNIVTNPDAEIVTSGAIMSSASVAPLESRNPNWLEDFYLEDVEIETVIGMNSQSRGTNALTMKFKIYEPHGATFFERLIATCADINVENYKEMYYLMKISFLGYDQEGTPTVIPDTTKYIAFVILSMKMSITERGSEYEVSAVPAGQTGFSIMKVSTPGSIDITAASVSDYFSTSLDYDVSLAAEQQAELALPAPNYSNVKSFATGLNRFERAKADGQAQAEYDEYYVRFDPVIGTARLTKDSEKIPTESVPMDPSKPRPVTDVQIQGDLDRRRALALRRTEEAILETVAEEREVDAVFTFTARTGQKANFFKLNPTLRSRLIAMARDYRAQFGEKIIITSAFRTTEDQLRIINAPADAGANYLVGGLNSLHLSGNAVDINSPQARKADESGLLAKHGLKRPYPVKDPVHIELSERVPAVASKPNPTTAEVANSAVAGELNYGVVNRVVNQGTNLIDEINRVITTSSYVLDQLEDPTLLEGKTPQQIQEALSKMNSSALSWWKITPTVIPKSFDKIRGVYAKRFVYDVKPYVIRSSSMPLTPSGPPAQWVKEYNYIFTGQNTDVLDFKLEFNNLYFIAISADAYKLASNRRSPGRGESGYVPLPEDHRPNGIGRPPVYPTPSSKAALARESDQRTGKHAVAGDLLEYLLNSQGADLIAVDLEIVGDPGLIKQDDMFSPTVDRSSIVNGSVPMDNGEVYIRINFRSPVEYDTDTGLATQYQKSIFSGVYKVLTVNNKFSGGKFTQVMRCVRLFNNPQDNPREPITSTNN
jgi:hypothetical protein